MTGFWNIAFRIDNSLLVEPCASSSKGCLRPVACFQSRPPARLSVRTFALGFVWGQVSRKQRAKGSRCVRNLLGPSCASRHGAAVDAAYRKVGALFLRFSNFFQKQPSRLDSLQFWKLAFCVSAVPTFETICFASTVCYFWSLVLVFLRDVSGLLLVFGLDRPPIRPSIHSLSVSFGVSFLTS